MLFVGLYMLVKLPNRSRWCCTATTGSSRRRAPHAAAPQERSTASVAVQGRRRTESMNRGLCSICVGRLQVFLDLKLLHECMLWCRRARAAIALTRNSVFQASSGLIASSLQSCPAALPTLAVSRLGSGHQNHPAFPRRHRRPRLGGRVLSADPKS